MDEALRLALIVALMALVTYLPRVLPLQCDFSGWPAALRDAIEFLPVSIISAMVVPPLIDAGMGGGDGADGYALWVAAATLGCALKTRNLLVTVVVGTALHILTAS